MTETTFTDRDLMECDWGVLPYGDKLHFVRGFYIHDFESESVTECGRRGVVSIPGIFTRMGAERCKRCCEATGYPYGVGSPKNDKTCSERLTQRLSAPIGGTPE